MTPSHPAAPRNIYKIEAAPVWDAAQRDGCYSGSADDLRDGFIHFSTAAQVPGTFAKYFAGRPNLVLAQIDTRHLGENLRWEASRGGQLFPHLYAVLDMRAVTWTQSLAADAAERNAFPPEMI